MCSKICCFCKIFIKIFVKYLLKTFLDVRRWKVEGNNMAKIHKLLSEKRCVM